MNVPFGGGCACGAIRYECAGAPRYMGNCHCTHCQQATGGASMSVVVVKESDFALLSGEPSWFERPSDGGHPMRRAFCPACGSPLFLTNGAPCRGPRAICRKPGRPELVQAQPGNLRDKRAALGSHAPRPPPRRGDAGAKELAPKSNREHRAGGITAGPARRA